MISVFSCVLKIVKRDYYVRTTLFWVIKQGVVVISRICGLENWTP